MIKNIVRYTPDVFSKFATSYYFKIGSILANGTKQFHSSPQSIDFRNMKVKIVPALKDNYMYLIIDEKTREAAAVDPVEPSKILDASRQENANLKTVLTTHHHWDHAGGNKEISKLCPGLEIVGGDSRVDGLTKKVAHNDKVKIGDLTVHCLSTPCHTKGHVCYYIEGKDQPPVVFTGDTLFTAGCGRFFEGTANEMYRNLIEVLGNLPDNTQVFSGHEYSVNNLKFAKHVEPNNANINKRLEWALEQREKNIPVMPSTIEEEKRTNPFMRVCDSEMQKIIGNTDPITVMGALREKKDGFKA